MPLSEPVDIQREFYRRMDGEALIQSDFTEFLNIAEGILAVAGSGGFISPPAIGTTNDHPGVWNLNTGLATTGRIFLLSRGNAYTVGVGGETKFQSWINTPTLSTPLQRFTIRTGFFSIGLPNIIVQGIGFEYDDSQNGGRWQAICDDAPGVETSVDTGILVTATWFKHELIINAAGTEVQFFIDNNLVATITTNIPSGAGFSHFLNIHIMKLIGVTNRSFYLDAYAILQDTEGRE